jgi:hypothetical protein
MRDEQIKGVGPHTPVSDFAAGPSTEIVRVFFLLPPKDKVPVGLPYAWWRDRFDRPGAGYLT